MDDTKTIGPKQSGANVFSRRAFLQAVSGAVPAVGPIYMGVASQGIITPPSADKEVSEKFTPIELTPYFNCSPTDFGPREQAKRLSGYAGREGLIRTPSGRQSFRGIPFLTGPESADQKSWVTLSTLGYSWSARTIEILIQHRANFLCFASFCDWDKDEMHSLANGWRRPN
jgi:hypothetical protein